MNNDLQIVLHEMKGHIDASGANVTADVRPVVASVLELDRRLRDLQSDLERRFDDIQALVPLS